jgi:osmotically-inducible protein OsmY
MVASMKSLTRDELGQAVFYYLKEQPDLYIADLKVKAEDGVVTLEGFVNSREKKKAAEERAMEVRGVKAVASDLAVKPVPEKTDTELAQNVLRAFQTHGSVPLDQIEVIVSKGRITLEGTVPTVFERLLAEAVAKNLPGNVGVQNHLIVEPRTSFTWKQGIISQESIVVSNNHEAETELGAAEAG